jgi:hypothetical protein
MPENWIDPVAAWKRLHPKVQEQLGAAAVAVGLGDLGAALSDASERFDAVAAEAGGLIAALVEQHIAPDGPPDGIDLAPLGIRQCRECGCTDTFGCAEGCEWVEDDLCSACVEKRERA